MSISKTLGGIFQFGGEPLRRLRTALKMVFGANKRQNKAADFRAPSAASFLPGILSLLVWLLVASTVVAVVGHIKARAFEDNGRW